MRMHDSDLIEYAHFKSGDGPWIYNGFWYYTDHAAKKRHGSKVFNGPFESKRICTRFYNEAMLNRSMKI